MYKFGVVRKSSLESPKRVEGETIEMKMRRVLESGEPITDGAPEVFTEKGEGVKAGYNIRTDRWEVAVDAMDAVDRSYKAKRENKPKMEVVKDEKVDGVESTQDTAVK